MSDNLPTYIKIDGKILQYQLPATQQTITAIPLRIQFPDYLKNDPEAALSLGSGQHSQLEEMGRLQPIGLTHHPNCPSAIAPATATDKQDQNHTFATGNNNTFATGNNTCQFPEDWSIINDEDLEGDFNLNCNAVKATKSTCKNNCPTWKQSHLL